MLSTTSSSMNPVRTDPPAGPATPGRMPQGWRWAPAWVLAYVALWPAPGYAEGVLVLGAIEAGGSTLGDAQYVDLLGEGGSYQDDHHVYGRAGERCGTCGVGWIRRTVSAQRSTHYCPRCQR